ncbi:MAG: sulfatase-like hydrolase/transferase, partial [Planctomycetia bacterium]|nr:sulfatase-like hydrolase/transferase [Planctomycetia bacterium]
NDYAASFLDEALAHEKPFLLYVAHIAPHWPLHAREADVARYRERYRTLGWDQLRSRRFETQRQIGLVSAEWKLSPRPAGVRDWEADAYQDWQAERMAVYAAQVSAIDRGVGELLQKLRDAGKVENTLVMFLSDNGAAPDGGLVPSQSGFGFGPTATNDRWRTDGIPIRPGSGPDNLPGPHDTFAAYGLAWANASNTPLRGTKMGAYEGGIRTPLVARWPTVIHNRGSITNQPGHVIDFMATCLDVANANYPTEFKGRHPLPVEGKSLLPIFKGNERAAHGELCWSVPRHQAIRVGKWKGVRPRHDEAWQLFDLEADGTETNDLAQREPMKLAELTSRFEVWRSRVGAEE